MTAYEALTLHQITEVIVIEELARFLTEYQNEEEHKKKARAIAEILARRDGLGMYSLLDLLSVKEGT